MKNNKLEVGDIIKWVTSSGCAPEFGIVKEINKLGEAAIDDGTPTYPRCFADRSKNSNVWEVTVLSTEEAVLARLEGKLKS